MTDLTDKWKKGELPDGYYYCETGNGVEILRTWGDKYNQLINNLDEVFIKEMDDCKIISEVPSYDEWQASEKYNKHLEEVIKIYERKDKQATETSVAYNELLEENTKLKELMKECRYIMGIEKEFASCHVEKDKLCKLLIKINKALGEDK